MDIIISIVQAEGRQPSLCEQRHEWVLTTEGVKPLPFDHMEASVRVLTIQHGSDIVTVVGIPVVPVVIAELLASVPDDPPFVV